MKLPFKESHLYLIAINEYDHINDFPTLYSPENDARALEELLSPALHQFTIHRPNSTDYDSIISLLKRMPEEVGPDDRVIFYFAGHGHTVETDKGGAEGYLIPKDGRLARSNDVIRNEERGGRRWISMKTLLTLIEKVDCSHLLLILDCCFAGSLVWADYNYRSLGLEPQKLYQEHFDFFVHDRARQAIVSAAFDQTAKDTGWRSNPNLPRSPFVDALIDGLNGAADFDSPTNPSDGVITVTELSHYLRIEVDNKARLANITHRQTPKLISLRNHDKGEFIFLTEKARSRRLPSAVEATRENNPFKGLEPFSEKDRERFFGREEITNDLVKFCESADHSFVVVTGISGSGKSSLVHAGLTPALKNAGWEFLGVIRPSLKEQAISKPTGSATAFVVLDQLEEIATESKDVVADAGAFMEAIYKEYTNNNVKVIMTLRSDAMNRIPKSLFEKEWTFNSFPIRWFSREEIKEIVTQPVFNIAFFYDSPKLVDTIIDDVLQSTGSLPMLSTLLSELYLYSIRGIAQRGPKRLLYSEDYSTIGGVAGALQSKLGQIGDDKSKEKILRKILLRLVNIDGALYLKRKASSTDLTYSDDAENKEIFEMVDALLRERIISTVEGEERWEPVHDSVVRPSLKFTLLNDWINKIGFERMAIQKELEIDLLTYEANGNSEKELWHNNDRLERLFEEYQEQMEDPSNLGYFPLNKRERSFIKASKEYKTKRKRRRATEIIIAFVALGALTIASWVFFLRARTSEREAIVNAGRADSTAKVAEKSAEDARRELYNFHLERYGTLITHAQDNAKSHYYIDAFLEYDSAMDIRSQYPDPHRFDSIMPQSLLKSKMEECRPYVKK